jgi:hypothetical protein
VSKFEHNSKRRNNAYEPQLKPHNTVNAQSISATNSVPEVVHPGIEARDPAQESASAAHEAKWRANQEGWWLRQKALDARGNKVAGNNHRRASGSPSGPNLHCSKEDAPGTPPAKIGH